MLLGHGQRQAWEQPIWLSMAFTAIRSTMLGEMRERGLALEFVEARDFINNLLPADKPVLPLFPRGQRHCCQPAQGSG